MAVGRLSQAPCLAQAVGGDHGRRGGYSGLQRLTPADCPPHPGPRSLGRDPWERQQRLGGCSPPYAGWRKASLFHTHPAWGQGPALQGPAGPGLGSAPHSPPNLSPTLPLGLWHRDGKHPQGLVPGNYQANSRRFPLPTLGSACCAFPDSGPAVQSAPGNLRGPVIALELPKTLQGKHAPAPRPGARRSPGVSPPSSLSRCGDQRMRGLRGLRRARWASSDSMLLSQPPGANGDGVRVAGGAKSDLWRERGHLARSPGKRALGTRAPPIPSLRWRGASLMSLVIILQV